MKPLYLLISAALLFSCDQIKEKTKNTINKSGEGIGQSATEFFEGVGEGIDETLKLELKLSEELMEKGLSTGKYYVSSSEKGDDNVLTLYLIFNKDIDQDITVKAFDKHGLESGRTTVKVSGKAGGTSYYDFVFDSRTRLESKGKITFE